MTSQPDMQGIDPKALEAAPDQHAMFCVIEEHLHLFPHMLKNDGIHTLHRIVGTYLASLPQQTAEPVAWVTPETLDDLLKQRPWTAGAIGEFSQREKDNYTVPLYTHPASPPIDAERYVLGLIAEEAGEVLQWCGKSLRFGFDTPGRRDPVSGDVTGETPRTLMPPELGDLLAAIDFAAAHGLIDMFAVQAARQRKLAKLLNPDAKDNLGRPLAPQPTREASHD